MKTYRVWTGREIIETSEPEDGVLLLDTEMSDKHGVPIYESDIVTLARGASVLRGVVEWDEGANRFMVRAGNEMKILSTDYYLIEVVGNAFEEGV